MSPVLAVVLAGLVAGPTANQSPPIFQPGAPGAASRVISAGEAVALSRTTHTEADIGFMQHMLAHHAQAVEMVALLQTRGADETVRKLAQRIGLSQESEIELMRGWLADRGRPVLAADLHAGHAGHAGHASDTPLMPGMLSPAQMQALAAANGAAFDRLFIDGMIQHHQGALDMVESLMATPDAAEDPLLSDFAAAVVADQSAEIARMRSIFPIQPDANLKERP